MYCARIAVLAPEELLAISKSPGEDISDSTACQVEIAQPPAVSRDAVGTDERRLKQKRPRQYLEK
jgi:hypothetical protein